MKKSNKAHFQKIHAKRRALERYGFDLNNEKYNQIVRLIQRGEANFVRRQSLRVSIFSLFFEDKECVVVYDRFRKSLASFLPIEAKYEDTFKGNGHVPQGKTG